MKDRILKAFFYIIIAQSVIHENKEIHSIFLFFFTFAQCWIGRMCHKKLLLYIWRLRSPGLLHSGDFFL